MKRKILIGSFLLVMAALFVMAGTPSTNQSTAQKATGERLITVLNPAISSKVVERVPLGPRIETVEVKTIYLVDMQWGGPEAAYSVFEEMQGWFAKNMPSVKTEIRRTGDGPFASDDAKLRKEIVEKKVAAVVIGIGG